MTRDDSNSVGLLRRSIAGDQTAWGRLVDIFEPAIIAQCRKRGLSESDAQDISQEVFLTVFHKLSQFHKGGSFRVWIHRITTNKIIDFHRRRTITAESASEEQLAQIAEEDTEQEFDLLPDVWLKANPKHRWDIEDIRKVERQKSRKRKIAKRRRPR